MSKTIIMLTNAYPYTEKGETFITDEINVISKYLSDIYIVPREKVQENELFKPHLPENVHLYPLCSPGKFNKLINLLMKPGLIIEIIKELIKDYKNKDYIIRYAMKAIAAQITVKKIISENNLNTSDIILYSYWFHFNALAVALYPDKVFRKISRAHGYDFYKYRSKQVYKPYTMSKIDNVYSASEKGTIYIKMEYGFDNVETAMLGVINKFIPLKYEKSDSIKIVSCSRLIPLKRVNLIIDVLSKIDFIDVYWMHIGDGEEKENLHQYAEKKLDGKRNIQYKFNGYLTNSQVFKIYKYDIFDLFITLSASEGGAPVSIQEALSFGMPVIATDVGGCAQLVNSKTGVLIEQEQDEMIIQAAVEAIKLYVSYDAEEIQKLRDNCYQHWQENFDAEKVYTDFINKIIGLKEDNYG